MNRIKFKDWEDGKYYYNSKEVNRHPFLYTLKYGRIYRKQQHTTLPFIEWHEVKHDLSYNYIMDADWIEFKIHA